MRKPRRANLKPPTSTGRASSASLDGNTIVDDEDDGAEEMPSDSRQTRRATGYKVNRGSDANNLPGGRPGVGVDAGGAPVIDPTENVLALVDAQARFQREMDAAAEKHFATQIEHVHQFFDMVIVAERRRVDDLAVLKKDYDNQIAETQRGQMKTTSDLVSTQLDKVTTSLSETINKTSDNIGATLATMNERLAKVEQFRYEMGGRAAVSDPAMTQIANDLAQLKLVGGRQEGQETEAARKIATVARETALHLQKTQAEHSGTSVAIQLAVGIIALLSLLMSIGGILFIANRPSPQPVYQAPSHMSFRIERI